MISLANNFFTLSIFHLFFFHDFIYSVGKSFSLHEKCSYLHIIFFLTIFLSVNWMYLIFLSAPSLFNSNILFKASIHAKAIYLQMFHHFELLLYLDILHVLKAKGDGIQRSQRKYCRYVTDPTKKETRHLFYGFEISWLCCSMARKKSRKAID